VSEGIAPAIPTILVVGASGSGKTTFIERVVPRLRDRGFVVGTVKHASRGFEVDQSHKDSARHFNAGATTTLLVGPEEQVLFRRATPEQLSVLVARSFAGCDLVLAEGFSWERGLRVLIHRRGCTPKPPPAADDVLLVVTDEPLGYPLELAFDDLEAAVEHLVAAIDTKGE
jgi:molybdopterin-guanine dinucleotide biosynthesis protein MobB